MAVTQPEIKKDQVWAHRGVRCFLRLRLCSRFWWRALRRMPV